MRSFKYTEPIVLLLSLMMGLFGCQERPPPTEVRVGTNPYLGDLATYVALEQGYFSDQGLQIDLVKQPSGVKALTLLFQQEVDIAHVADLPIAYIALNPTKYTNTSPPPIYIFADLIYSTHLQGILTRTDHGITSPADLPGKRIGMDMNTSLEYMFDTFLLENNLTREEMELVDLNVNRSADSLLAGSIDAMASWQPYLYETEKQLGQKALRMDPVLNYRIAWLATTTQAFAERNPEVLIRYLEALQSANQYIKRHPDSAMGTLAHHTGVDTSVIRGIWNIVDYQLSLSEPLISTLEDQARWILRNDGQVPHDSIPDFTKFIYFNAMESVHPEGITIIR
ncbi:MAG: NrtA/SsuA/CpmA family ABC transporter substrate-binding protein [Candidatus Marinimicrobia bacterium]|nr:NrtA/SsuA/CpmA family ABC transporter substrate-binding protein [Candidatus Neomarinimicrobiota bacterium]MCF7830325.1 NrtA/SsuA/CpmA family ABC transporter substrate-binding protein [Candidatus Neomarinimicrobiota bacterium]MCF7882302.1 NrtA/SsuA/CpmA family ABC transporter substrate-binding protein [Candidatus Neomarinimicrobiota bacterium]